MTHIAWHDNPSRMFELDATAIGIPATLKRRRGGNLTVASYDTGFGGVESAAFATEAEARAWVDRHVAIDMKAEWRLNHKAELAALEHMADALDRMAMLDADEWYDEARTRLSDAFDMTLRLLVGVATDTAYGWSSAGGKPLVIETDRGERFTSWRQYLAMMLDRGAKRVIA